MTAEAEPRPMSQRLVSIASFEGGVLESTTTFGYSAAGELVSKMVEDGVGNPTRVEVYTWTPKGEMASASIDESGDGDVDYLIQHAHDDRGTLVERTSLWEQGGTGQSVTERYLVDYENPTGYSQVVAEWRQVGSDANFVLARLYSYGDDLRAETTLVAAGGSTGAGGGGPPAFAHVPGVQFPLRDALGTVRASAGFGSGLTPGEASINDYRYSAFGLPLGENFAPADASTRGSLTSQSAPSPWAFTGQRVDPATGLQYHRARWLDMTLGRWASVDPVWDWPGNLGGEYAYGGRLVANSLDAAGTKLTLGEALIVGVVGAIIGAMIGFTIGGTKGALWGALAGVAAALTLPVLLPKSIAYIGGLMLSGLLLFIGISDSPHELGATVPAPPSVGYKTFDPGHRNKRYAFVSIQQGEMRPAMSSANVLDAEWTRAIADVLAENGYTVVYGRPSSLAQFERALAAYPYSVIYILGHGAYDTHSSSSKVQLTDKDTFHLMSTQGNPGQIITMQQVLNRYKAQLVFIDGCDTGSISDLNSSAVISSTDGVEGLVTKRAHIFFRDLFERANGNVSDSFYEIYKTSLHKYSLDVVHSEYRVVSPVAQEESKK